MLRAKSCAHPWAKVASSTSAAAFLVEMINTTPKIACSVWSKQQLGFQFLQGPPDCC